MKQDLQITDLINMSIGKWIYLPHSPDLLKQEISTQKVSYSYKKKIFKTKKYYTHQKKKKKKKKKNSPHKEIISYKFSKQKLFILV